MLETIGALVVSLGLSFVVLAVLFFLSSLVIDRFTKQEGLETAITAGMIGLVGGGVTLILTLHYIVGITIQR